MAATDTSPMIDENAVDPDATALPRCRVCAHDEAAHDRIATRFCAATTAGGLDRGCACRV